MWFAWSLASFGFVACGVCSACSSVSSGGAGGARTGDASGASDAGIDAPPESGPGDAAPGTDTAESGPESCRSVDAVCPADAAPAGAGQFTYHCVTSWAAARQPATFCSYDPAVYVLPDCGGFDLVADINVDVSYFYYYDRNSGALVGIGFNDSKGNLRCIAGTVMPVDISKCGWSPTATSECPLADGGAD